VRVQDRFVLHIRLKDRVGIKHRTTIDQPQLKPHLHIITLRITDGATTPEKEFTGNRTTNSERRIVRDALS
ncbi:MAG: hypothetical protein EZS28_044788, partial [Streblomastix strix]